MPSSAAAARIAGLIFRTLPLAAAAGLLLAGVAINLANVIARYVFLAAFYWAEEAMVYLSVWAIFLAAIAVAYDGAALTMDFFFSRMPESLKRLVSLAIAAVTVAVSLFMAWQSVQIARVLIRNDQKSIALEIPMVVPQAALMFGFVLIAAAVLVRFALAGHSGGSPADASSPDSAA
jgi:TRAP-type C4-dicarboxylate transport system permease small subunit